MSVRVPVLQLVLAAGLAGLAGPALAADQAGPRPPIPPAPAAVPLGRSGPDRVAWEEARADWLIACRQRFDDTGKVTGGVADAAIGDSSDRRRTRDYCERYLDRYMASYGPGYGDGYPPGQLAYGYAMQPMMVMVPVVITGMAAPTAPQQNCTETEVIEEWVPVAGPARRAIPRRVAPAKRVPPDKRLPLK